MLAERSSGWHHRREWTAINGVPGGGEMTATDRAKRASSGIGRRNVLKGLGATGALAASGLGFPALAATGPIKIGVLVPLTGDADMYAEQMRMGIETAIAEINAGGGLFGRELAAAYADSATTPAGLPDTCKHLAERQQAIAVIGGWISASRRFAPSHMADYGIPVIHASNHEGGFCHPGLFSVGPTTAHDGHALAKYLVDSGAGKNWFMLGSYPSWQNAMFRQIRFPVYPRGVHVLGQASTDVGERDFEPIIRWIEHTGAETVLFCVMRHHAREFIAQAKNMGLLDKVTLGWIGYNDALNDGIEPSIAEQIVTATTFVSTDQQAGVRKFVGDVRAQFSAVPVSYLAFTHYNAVMALKAAWRGAGEASPAAGMHGLAGLTFDSPTGPITISAQSHHSTMNAYIARGGADGLEMIEALGPIGADAGCEVRADQRV